MIQPQTNNSPRPRIGDIPIGMDVTSLSGVVTLLICPYFLGPDTQFLVLVECGKLLQPGSRSSEIQLDR